MNIECPNCHAAYDVPDSRMGALRVGARRLVRCGTCSHAWPVGGAEAPTDAAAGAVPHGSLDGSSDAHPVSQPDAAPAPQVPAIAAAGDRLAPPRPAAPRDALLTGAWAASALLIIGIATAACVWRGDVASAWPPAARILGTAPRAAVVAEAHVPRPPPRQYPSPDAPMPSPARHD